MIHIITKYYFLLLLITISTNISPSATSFSIPQVHVGSSKQRITTQRKGSFPYLSGDTFRNICDHIVDVDVSSFSPANIKQGDTIFVYPYLLDFFFSKIHPHIKNHYILVSHDTDIEIPGKFLSHLDDDNLIAWFGKNCRQGLHKKLHGLPIGLANSYWRHGNISTIQDVQLDNNTKKHLLYMNFTPQTNKQERSFIYHLFKDIQFCHIQKRQSFKTYIVDLAESKFVLSPRGNGEDTHRTWETLYMGAIPIVQSSFLDPLFEGLPVLIITDWSKVTKEFLNKKYKEITQGIYYKERIYAPFWLNKIKQMQHACRVKQ